MIGYRDSVHLGAGPAQLVLELCDGGVLVELLVDHVLDCHLRHEAVQLVHTDVPVSNNDNKQYGDVPTNNNNNRALMFLPKAVNSNTVLTVL